MKSKRMLISVGIVASLAVVSGIAISATQDKYTLKITNGLAFSEFRGYESWQVIAISHNGNLIAATLGNPVMIAAYKAGIPENGKPFPDGARMAKVHWNAKKDEEMPGEPTVPGTQHDIDFMVKDSKRFADSGGWGWGEFEYDAASNAFRPGNMSDKPPPGERCQVRVRVPHGSSESGLRFHKVRDEVSGRNDAKPPVAAILPSCYLTKEASLAEVAGYPERS